MMIMSGPGCLPSARARAREWIANTHSHMHTHTHYVCTPFTHRVLLGQHQHGLEDLDHGVVHAVVAEGRDLLPVLAVGVLHVPRVRVVPVLGVRLQACRAMQKVWWSIKRKTGQSVSRYMF